MTKELGIKAKEIIDNEIFLKSRRAKWRRIRFVFYFLVFLLILVPLFLPVPFAPEFIHDIFGGKNGGIFAAFSVLFFVLSLFTLFLAVFYEFIVRHRLNNWALLEFFSVPAYLVSLFLLFGMIFDETPKKIALINEGKQPEEFSNPFLGYKMLDCRNVSEEYDVIFIPANLANEYEFLAYAPRKKDKTIDYKRGKKYGEDWYLDKRSSIWKKDLMNCVEQNKSPNS